MINKKTKWLREKTKRQREINKKIVEALRYGYSVRRVIHKGWLEIDNIKEKYIKNYLLKRNPKGYFGKYQYIYSSNNGEISLIKLNNHGTYGVGGRDVWEIYSHDTLFQDTFRFRTKKEAEAKIKGYLLK